MKGRWLFLLVFGLIGCGGQVEVKQAEKKEVKQEKQPAPQPVNLPTRAELRRKIEGLDQNQLLQVLGRPDKTDEASADYQVWYYRRGMAKDEITGRVCPLMIDLKKGKVVDVQFH